MAIIYSIALLGVAVMLFLLLVPTFLLPAEDVVSLFQFSESLAHFGAIIYSAFDPHVEGATGFAWMVLIAAGLKLHFGPFWAVAFANLASRHHPNSVISHCPTVTHYAGIVRRHLETRQRREMEVLIKGNRYPS